MATLPVRLGLNLLAHLPPNVSQAEASAELRSVFSEANRQEDDRLLGQMVSKYLSISKKLAAWLETNAPEELTVFALPCEHRRRLHRAA